MAKATENLEHSNEEPSTVETMVIETPIQDPINDEKILEKFNAETFIVKFTIEEPLPFEEVIIKVPVEESDVECSKDLAMVKPTNKKLSTVEFLLKEKNVENTSIYGTELDNYSIEDSEFDEYYEDTYFETLDIMFCTTVEGTTIEDVS